jgi:hypothetical protein
MIVKLSNFTATNKWEGQGKKRRKRSGVVSIWPTHPLHPRLPTGFPLQKQVSIPLPIPKDDIGSNHV